MIPLHGHSEFCSSVQPHAGCFPHELLRIGVEFHDVAFSPLSSAQHFGTSKFRKQRPSVWGIFSCAISWITSSPLVGFHFQEPPVVKMLESVTETLMFLFLFLNSFSGGPGRLSH